MRDTVAFRSPFGIPEHYRQWLLDAVSIRFLLERCSRFQFVQTLQKNPFNCVSQHNPCRNTIPVGFHNTIVHALEIFIGLQNGTPFLHIKLLHELYG